MMLSGRSMMQIACPPTKSDFDLINQALSNQEYGASDLYEKLDIPALLRGDSMTVLDPAARGHAAAIARGLPHVLFLLPAHRIPHFLFLLLDGTVVQRESGKSLGFDYKLSDLRAIFIPLAVAMREAMLARGLSHRAVRSRLFSILVTLGVENSPIKSIYARVRATKSGAMELVDTP
jgi:hypothetical protein